MSRALPPRPVAQGRVAGAVCAGVAAATLLWAAAEAALYPTGSTPHTFTPEWAAASAQRAAAAGMSPFRHWAAAPVAAAAADAARAAARVRGASAGGYAAAH